MFSDDSFKLKIVSPHLVLLPDGILAFSSNQCSYLSLFGGCPSQPAWIHPGKAVQVLPALPSAVIFTFARIWHYKDDFCPQDPAAVTQPFPTLDLSQAPGYPDLSGPCQQCIHPISQTWVEGPSSLWGVGPTSITLIASQVEGVNPSELFRGSTLN